MTTHHMSGTPTYTTWRKMRERCRNPKSAQWKWYGARGISVCARWESFENFLADMGERPAGHTLDRYPNRDGNYEPGNCRWANHAEQILGQERTIHVVIEGRRMSLSAACRRLGLPFARVYNRMRKKGMEFAEAIARGHLREKKTDETLRQYAALRKAGKTHKQIAAVFNMSHESLEKWSADARHRGWL